MLAVLHRALHPLAVAVGVERELASGRRRSARAATCGSRPTSCARRGARSSRRTPRGYTGCRVRTLYSLISTWKPALDFLHRADDEAVGVQLAPAVERDVAERGGLGNRAVDVARDERELALEVEVVPQHLADRLRGGDRFGVGRQRDEVGNREPRRDAAFAADGGRDFGRLLRRREAGSAAARAATRPAGRSRALR